MASSYSLWDLAGHTFVPMQVAQVYLAVREVGHRPNRCMRRRVHAQLCLLLVRGKTTQAGKNSPNIRLPSESRSQNSKCTYPPSLHQGFPPQFHNLAKIAIPSGAPLNPTDRAHPILLDPNAHAGQLNYPQLSRQAAQRHRGLLRRAILFAIVGNCGPRFWWNVGSCGRTCGQVAIARAHTRTTPFLDLQNAPIRTNSFYNPPISTANIVLDDFGCSETRIIILRADLCRTRRRKQRRASSAADRVQLRN
ncbi:hypothetical protein FB45DRAFT_1009359 [Roridomyces roridus]|uniref:Uncharacterized protein n=1 Tax=Roridomyces roridus TaxID=1738132 RepID=A0AAD7B6Y8_9AGAR|nr:hypothetical protein FB45DRAFT_1009359 [Roridomyces roridus]